MAHLRTQISQIIEFHYEDLNVPVTDSSEFYEMVKDLVKYAKNYNPEENRDSASSEVNYLFTTKVYEMLEDKQILPKVKDEILEFLRENLKYYCGWAPQKEPMITRLQRRINQYLVNPSEVENPCITIGPEYLVEIYESYVRFINYVNSDEFWGLMNPRLIQYLEQDFVEGASGGTRNMSKIRALLQLMEYTGRDIGEDFSFAAELSKYVGKEMLRKYEDY